MEEKMIYLLVLALLITIYFCPECLQIISLISAIIELFPKMKFTIKITIKLTKIVK